MSDQPRRRLPVVDGPVRVDMDDGMRFLHIMEMQTKHELIEAQASLLALLEELVALGRIDPHVLEERRQVIKDREEKRLRQLAHVQVAENPDKYTLTGLPEIDCAARLPLCKARCCSFHFPLSFQDLDERVVEWDYAKPYIARKRKDGQCVHLGEETMQCTVYEKRPGACRVYDCRKDQRVWLDFEKRIPAP